MIRTPMETALAQFAAYRVGDRQAARILLDEDMTFTSPQDDHLDKAAFLETCFATAERFLRHEITAAVEIEPGTVMLRYTAQLPNEPPFSNVELVKVVDGQITEIELYFGGVEAKGSGPSPIWPGRH
ncbi:nuclear transport factor 2 family protein [Nesterenkonia sp. LB17]|uniref:nuclear transport factor 2 family protein n=1 Tax=unclassified Nesterenkonia TaxID=2629769 RepID=UPI001F4CA900|nr:MULTISPECIES: nuclear transport factor 2 family protein [unclassified Nesterenkonia]MCH8559630.1 nuclear transport factor 2 family protein [Nesterenkonia sp. DZ6]MCH8561809.1 nuclear transport factor 2 family protein [Nesterenkonia sp. YGD6]MCH8564662.1 nuclear transport factor 2 family protein [Nesterenkonia sp. LB17]MCH8570283.1 nuclear transport factor 2 family protein [Nesterenkonia sp. AY15]